MVKGLSSYLKKAWKKPKELASYKSRLIDWRRGGSVVKIDKPLRLDRARALGYKAKKGFIVVRVKLLRGGRKRPKRRKGRKGKRQTIRKTLMLNYKGVAEIRAEKKFKNLIVLNSYTIGKDGKHYFYEVILIDPNRPEIKKDKNMKNICLKKARASRGLTSSGKKSRGLRKSTKKGF